MDTISMRTTEVNVNGTRIEGWSDGECFTPPQEAEIARIRRGADGFKARFATGELGGPVMLSLLPTSPSAIFLNNLFQEARDGRRRRQRRRRRGVPRSHRNGR